MSNEITYQFQILLNNGRLKDQYSSSSIAASQSTAALVRNVETISNAAHSALDLAGVSTPGFMVVQNLDPTNYIEVGIDVGGTFYAFLKLKPGEQGMVRLGTTAPYALANTAPAKLFYVIYAD